MFRLMLQHSVRRVWAPLLSESSVTAPSGSFPKTAVADAKLGGRRKRQSLERFSRQQKHKWRKKKMIANSGLCVTAAIKAEPNSSLQTPAADTETGPLRWKLREVNSPQVCQLAKRNTSKSLRPAPLLWGCLELVAILWFVIQEVSARARFSEQACFAGTRS